MCYWLVIEETALARVALVDSDHLDADQLGFIGQHLDTAGVWHLNKVLIGSSTKGKRLLPPVILADHQRSNPFLYQQFHDAVALGMEVVGDLARTSRGDTLHQGRRASTTEFRLQMCLTLVVELVDMLERATVNKDGREPRFV